MRRVALYCVILGCGVHALRPTVFKSRRLLVGAAAATALLQTAPALADLPAPQATDLLGAIKELEVSGPKNQVTRTTHTPILTAASRGPALSLVEFKVDVPDEYIQFMWLKKYAPKAAPGYIDIIASVRLAPGEVTVLSKALPKGLTCVPMHYSTKNGVWEGLPFVVP